VSTIEAILGPALCRKFTEAMDEVFSDLSAIPLVQMARFYRIGYDLGRNESKEETTERLGNILEESRQQIAGGIESGRAAERVRWIRGGHTQGGECRANRKVRVSAAVETDHDITSPSPSLPQSPAATITIAAAVQTDLVVKETKSFSWADEMDNIQPIHPISTTTAPVRPRRDLSVLRSDSKRPFGSLQRRALSSHLASHSSVPSSRVKYPFSRLPTRHHPQAHNFMSHSEKTSRSYSQKSGSRSQYSWSSSLLVLSDLARALGNMGWKPPDFVYHAV
jgi:hypothetical protein